LIIISCVAPAKHTPLLRHHHHHHHHHLSSTTTNNNSLLREGVIWKRKGKKLSSAAKAKNDTQPTNNSNSDRLQVTIRRTRRGRKNK
jgi:hypothetical protein